MVVPRIPQSVEQSLGQLFLGNYAVEDSPETRYLQGILDRLVEHESSQTLDYQLHVEKSLMVNAMALPGGHIVIYRGLLDRVESENELAMILGHELGHFAERHHLKGLGRGLVLLVLSATLLGDQSGITQFLQDSLATVESGFSQRQEQQVDEFGLHILQKPTIMWPGPPIFSNGSKWRSRKVLCPISSLLIRRRPTESISSTS